MKRDIKVAGTWDGDYMVVKLDEDNHIEGYLKSDWTRSRDKNEARIHFHKEDAIWCLMIKRQKWEEIEPEPVVEPKEVQSWSDL